MNILQPSLSLGSSGAANDPVRIHEVARQLEGQFAQMLIKCMRDASFGDSLFPGENQTFRDMYDQQLATAMTQGKGLGLAPMIARQLGGTESTTPAPPTGTLLDNPRRLLPTPEADQALAAIAGRNSSPAPAALAATATTPFATASARVPIQAALPTRNLVAAQRVEACDAVEKMAAAAPSTFKPNTPERFVAEIWEHAKNAAKDLGVDPRALVAQAALETGWGRRGIQRNDGGSSHNLFGIKATGWKGERARVGTHEYTNGVKHSETADFRAYASPAESFADYVRLLKNNPRYQQALAAGKDIQGFARGLQKAGYATDPSYATKIASIANGPTLGKVLSAMGSAARGAADAMGTGLGAAAETLTPRR